MRAMVSPPLWSTISTGGYPYGPDGDWWYHVRIDGYQDILSLHIHAKVLEVRERVRTALRRGCVPSEETAEGFTVFGYVRDGQVADYIA